MRAASLEEFAEGPVGCYVSGNHFVHFCATPQLWGVLLWGRPSEEDAIGLGRSLVLELGPPAVPHVSVIDATRLEGGEPRAFLAAERYMRRHADRLKVAVVRLALIRPTGIGGAIVAGAYEVLPKPYPVSVFTDATAAFDWLTPGARAANMPGQLEALFASVSDTPAIVRALQAHLERNLLDPTLDAASAALGVSERSLQRRLADAQTTFRHEVGEARVRVAKRLLEADGAPLTTIALEVGCASLQHFSGVFRKHTGESPSAWRQRAAQARNGHEPTGAGAKGRG